MSWLDTAGQVAGIGLPIASYITDLVRYDENKRYRDSEVKRNQSNVDRDYKFGLDQFEYMKTQNALTQAREDTAVTRRMEDMVNAGLHPTLAAGGQGSPAQVMAGPGGHGGGAGSPVANAALDMEMTNASAQVANMWSQTRLNDATAEKMRSDAETNRGNLGVAQGHLKLGNDQLAFDKFRESRGYAQDGLRILQEDTRIKNQVDQFMFDLGVRRGEAKTHAFDADTRAAEQDLREWLAELHEELSLYALMLDERGVSIDERDMALREAMHNIDMNTALQNLRILQKSFSLMDQENAREWISSIGATILGGLDAYQGLRGGRRGTSNRTRRLSY